MGNIWIKEFTGGLDARRLSEASPGGTLIRAVNCHINRGGEIEQRASFIKAYDLPLGQTHGLAADEDGLVVFSHNTRPATLDAAIGFRRLQHPSAEALAEVTYTGMYDGRIQTIGRFADASRYVFTDSTRISDANAPPQKAGSGAPQALLTKDTKLYIGTNARNIFFSAVSDETDFGAGAGVGEGFRSIATDADGFEKITGLAQYGENIAIFSNTAILILFTDPDPDLNRNVQLLSNTGCLAPRSVTKFGDGDLFYLDASGVRSLRARDSSNSAATTDIGSAIDPLVTAFMAELGQGIVERAIGLIEPKDGRFWLIVKNRIYVFSYFSASKVSAWTYYDVPFTISHAVIYDRKVWVRENDSIWVYGGTGETFEYDASIEAEVWLPYLDANDPARKKHLTGIDATVRGTWNVSVAMDPNNEATEDEVANINKTTFPQERVPGLGEFSHLSLRFRSVAPASSSAPAVLSQAMIHFKSDAEEDS